MAAPPHPRMALAPRVRRAAVLGPCCARQMALGKGNRAGGPARRRGCAARAAEARDGEDDAVVAATLGRADPHEMHSLLSVAIATEDYALAQRIKRVMEAKRESSAAASADGVIPVDATATDWESIGAPGWLARRLQHLGFVLPTPVQRTTATALVRQLGNSSAVVASSTGSGKTLAYCVPLLSVIADSLKAVNTLRRLGAASTIRPIAMVVVPTRELGAQVALTLHSLLGGDPPRRQHTPGSRLSFFNYDGPTGVRIMGLFSDDDVERARCDCLLQGVSIVVGTPDQLAAAATLDALPEGPDVEPEPPLDLSVLRAVVIDEADAVITEERLDNLKVLLRDPQEMWEILKLAQATAKPADAPTPPPSEEAVESAIAADRERLTIFAGATLDPALIDAAVARRWLLNPAVCTSDGAKRWTPAETSSTAPLSPPLPLGMRHAYVATAFPERRLAALARVLRDEEACHRDQRLQGAGGPHRCVVYCASDEEAKKTAKALRAALWGTHVVSVLLPEQGAAQLGVLDDFRRGNATCLVIGPAGARGIDLGDTPLHAVACLGAPSDVEEYTHRAGRAGRIVKSAPDLKAVDEAGGEPASPSAFARRTVSAEPPLVISAVCTGSEETNLRSVCGALGIEPEAMAEPEAAAGLSAAMLDDADAWSEEQRDAVIGALEDVVSLLDVTDPSSLPEEERGGSKNDDE